MMIIIISILIIKRSKNDQSFIRELRWNDRISTRCDLMFDINDKHTFSSWLIHYFGSTKEDGFISTAVKLDYRVLTKKMDHITAAAICQE